MTIDFGIITFSHDGADFLTVQQNKDLIFIILNTLRNYVTHKYPAIYYRVLRRCTQYQLVFKMESTR